MPKILIVEDNEESRKSLAGRLQCSGYAVVMAGDGKAGVVMALEEKPDLVLMDINLPELDGWEAIQQIKAALNVGCLPVIAMTEHAMPGDRERAVSVGCVDCHDKPIEFSDLLAQIEAALQSSRAPAAIIVPTV